MSVAQRNLFFAARCFAVFAVLAGLGATLVGLVASDYVCFDQCPHRSVINVRGVAYPGYFSGGSVGLMGIALPCLALALVALLLFLAYCARFHQGRRALVSLFVALIPLIVAFVAFNYAYTQAATRLPVDVYGILLHDPLVSFMRLWNVGIGIFLCAWSIALAYLQWGFGRIAA